MTGLSPRARARVASLVVGSAFAAFAVLAVMPPAYAQETCGGSPAPRTAPEQPPADTFVVAQPALSPALIGLAIAQMVAQPQPAPSPAPPAPRDAQAARSLTGPPARPNGLVSLYASYALLEALDVHSTLRAIHGGAVEQNPVMAPIVNRPAAFVALKAATTAGAILAADRLSKHNRVAAYAVMFALNSAYAFIVVHNYRVGGR